MLLVVSTGCLLNNCFVVDAAEQLCVQSSCVLCYVCQMAGLVPLTTVQLNTVEHEASFSGTSS